jgi:hypothetical protein
MSAQQASSRNVGRTIRNWLLGGIVLLIGLVALYTWAVLSFTYSDGERTGYILKFSRKGWICKTWEGEMQLVAVPGAVPERFPFTVRDDAVARQINGVMGRQVSVYYRQHVGIPTSCFGDTGYFVERVRSTGNPSPAAPASMPVQ